MAKPNVLLLTLEYPRWTDAGKYSYESNFGFEEGFAANGIPFTTVPLMFGDGQSPWVNWFNSVHRQLRGKRFDQVWIDVVHTHYPDGFLDFIQSLAPTRVGYFGESSEFHPLELPSGVALRQKNVARALPYATHLIAVDEADVARFNQEGKTPAFWWASGFIPQRFITSEVAPACAGPALFHGTLYGSRQEWLAHPGLKGLLAQGTSLEINSPWPAQFDELNQNVAEALANGAVLEESMFSRFIDAIRQTRRACYPLWLQSLRQGCAVVNLPQFAKAYASRIIHGLAAGVPVITWEIPNRPLTRALYEPGKEILLYSADQPAQLAEHISRLQRDPHFASSLAANGLRKLRSEHTTERFIATMMNWLAAGSTRSHSSNAAPNGNNLGRKSSETADKIKNNGADSETDVLLTEIKNRGLWNEGQPLRLHLGCGEQRFDGYINVDYPPSEHNVMAVKADVFTNIITMEMPPGSVDEVRLHHVFEHFNRVTALAMIIKWQRWLKPGGILRIETPDLMGSARTLLSNVPLRVKMGVVRHLAGDQAASWAYHLEHWFPERYEHTLTQLGFGNIQTRSNTWATEPYLSNVEVSAVKTAAASEEELLHRADNLLKESMVAAVEQPTWEVWRQQLRDCIAGILPDAPINIPANPQSPTNEGTTRQSAAESNPAGRHGNRDLYLGLKLYGHDAAVFSIFPEEKDIFGIAEERLTRYKHDDLFPVDAIHRLISYKGIDTQAVENVYAGSGFICQKNEILPAHYYARTVALRRFLKASYTKDFAKASREFFALPQAEQIQRLQADEHGREFLRLVNDPAPKQTIDEQLRRHLGELFPRAAIHLNYHDHEYCHAISAYYSSGFDHALVVAFDGWGDDNTFSRVYLGEDGQLTELGACRSPVRELRFSPAISHECSIGGIYSYFTRFLGFTPDSDEGKVEALAAYGNWNNAIYAELMSLVTISSEKGIEIDHARATQLLNFDRIQELMGRFSKEDFSAAVQKFAEEVVITYLRPFIERTGARRICLSGGVTANVILNLRIYRELAEDVFIVPAMADDGAAQGAAILELLQHGFAPAGLKWLGKKQMPYWGSSYSQDEARQRISQFNEQQGGILAVTDASEHWPEQAAEAICRGEVGAIFHGRMEWGPRALGNRSIIADARNPEIRDILNRDIKNRPSFQPFCPSMLAEERERLFERSYQNRHMTIAFDLKREYWEALPGAIHIDGTSRVQFVTEADNPNYHRLLQRVKDITGFGVIINTSFNKHGRTIVESPEDALRDFLDSKLDFVVIEGCFVRRARRPVTKPAGTHTTGIIFSKDRALQLDAALHSFARRCRDAEQIPLKVLYTTSSRGHEAAYDRLRQAHPAVEFVREQGFKKDLLQLMHGHDHVLFVVDDNLFIRDFSLTAVTEALAEVPNAIGCSLRLGKNCTQCYSLNQVQNVPPMQPIKGGLKKFSWPGAQHDFGYPLEVSSSVYRTSVLRPLLESLDYNNPNTLEAALAENARRFETSNPFLLCFEQSIAFCAPVNVVQTTYENRCGKKATYHPNALATAFLAGRRIDINAYYNFVPTGCHQEVELKWAGESDAIKAPTVSVVIPCYNQAGFLPEAVGSVLAQTFADWEIIIVNDGSHDNTSIVAHTLISANPQCKIRLIEKDNGGLSDARNAGIKAARGFYILPLDADDLLHPEFLSKTAAVLDNEPGISIVYTDVEQFGVRNEIWRTRNDDPRSVLGNTRHAYCALYRRQVWAAVGGYNPNMVWGYEDWDFWVSCYEHGFKESHIAEPLMRYRTKAESMVTRALQHDAELRARIVKNHSSLYDDASNEWAERVLASAVAKAANAAEVETETAGSLLQSAGALFQTGDVRGVQAILTRAASLAPDNGEIAESLGSVLYQLGELEAAFEQLERAAKLRPDHAEAHVKFAMAAIALNRIEIFESALGRALELQPDHPAGLRLLANLNLQSGRFQDAARGYYRLLCQNPADVDALLAVARCFFELGDAESAKLSYERVLSVQPTNEIALDGLAIIQKRCTPSAASNTTPAELSPAEESLDSVLQRADEYFAGGNLPAASEQLRHATILAPDNLQIIETLGSLLFQMAEFNDAKIEFSLLTALAPDYAAGYVRLAHVCVKLGQIEEFEQAITTALGIDPTDTHALKLLADLNRDEGRYGDAARAYVSLLQVSPDNLDALFSLGFCFFKAGEIESARFTYERIQELDGENPVARENLAAIAKKPANPPDAFTSAPSPASSALVQATSATIGPKISVILPTFNRPEILARCLDGFARQTLPKDEFEIVVVDDGSQPPVEGTVSQFLGRLNVVYHYQENAGLAAARNTCIKLAKAPWLALHDDDDVPCTDYLAKCVAFHETNPDEADVLLAQVAPHSELPGTPLLEWVFNPSNSVIGFPAPGAAHDFSKFFGGTASCKRFLFDYCEYDPEYRFGFEDMEFAYRLNDHVKLRVHYHPEVISHLVRPVEFNGLFRRLYREGRSLRRASEHHGAPILNLMPPGINQSIETISRLEPHVPQLFAIMEKLGPDGRNDQISFTLEGKTLRGAEALQACYSLLAKYARAKGWVDFASGVTEVDGLRQINTCLEQKGQLDCASRSGNPVAASSAGEAALVPPQKSALVYFHSNPFPPRSGAHRRCLCLVDGLRALGYEVTLASTDLFTDQTWNDDSIFGLKRSHGINVRLHYSTPADRQHVEACSKRGDLWEIHTPPGLVEHFRSLARELSPSLAVINYAYCSGLVTGPEFTRTTKLVEMHDLVSLSGSMARTAAAQLPASPVRPETAPLNFLEESYYERAEFAVDPEEYRRYRQFDGVIAISPTEEAVVHENVPGTATGWLPVSLATPSVENSHAADPLLVIFSNAFNLQGYLYFVERVLPKIRRAFPEFTLRVAGDACRHIAPLDGVELLGFVPDLAPLYAESAFALCPLIGGTGQQVKIVEAMAHGLAVVTLRNVAASSPIRHGINGFIADNAEEFASYVINLYRDPALCRKMGEEARRTIAEEHSFSQWVDRLGEVIKRAESAKLQRMAAGGSPEIAAATIPKSTALPAKSPAPVTRPVRWFAPFFNPSGYASEAINFVVPLANQLNLGIHHHNRIYSERFVDGLEASERQILFRLRDRFPSLHKGIVISHSPAEGFVRPPDAEYVIGRTMFECAGLPPSWVTQCNLMDEVWVPSQFNLESFAAAGVERDKLVVVPEAVDETVFDPDRHTPLPLPNRAKFNFLSIFEWTSRKGWDALLTAYLQEFSAADDVCLYLRTYQINQPEGDARVAIHNLIQEFGAKLGLAGKEWPRIEILADQIPGADLPRLYLAVDCLVAPSRGEGWGRPQHEAMMMGLPVIGTNWSGNTEFMSSDTAYLLDYDLVEARQLEPELWFYRSHQWANPRVSHLQQLMRRVQQHPTEAASKGAAARAHVQKYFSRTAVSKLVLQRLAEIDHKLSTPACAPVTANTTTVAASPAPKGSSIAVAWSGSYLDLGSLSHVNRELTRRLQEQPGIRLARVGKNIIPPEHAKLRSLQETARTLRAQIPPQTSVTIRHSWPPNWEAPAAGAWVMIQPWEYGALPKEWVAQLSRVDEVWAYTEHIRRVYVDSGVDPLKVKVVPLGIDPEKFTPAAGPLTLSTTKRFKFLFVGGTIHRKGPDILLASYLKTFSASDDVCLVIKDFGGKGVYSGQTLESQIKAAQAQPNAPEILHLDSELPPESLPGLYTACDCLVHPYRGEGFGLPVLEAMACGLPIIVTGGGSTDDFASDEFACRIPALRTSIGSHVGSFELIRNGSLLEPDTDKLCEAMRRILSAPDEAKARGQAASEYVRREWTWEKAAQTAALRLRELLQKKRSEAQALAEQRARKTPPITLPAVAKIGSLSEARKCAGERKSATAWQAVLGAIDARPCHPEAWLLLAEIAAATGQNAKARTCAEQALQLAPSLKPARQFLKSLRNGNAKPASVEEAAQFPLPAIGAAPRLSVCLITKNEERFLDRCLESVRGIAWQIVVMDTGSSDQTIAIARKHGAETYSTVWADDFSAARNAALEHARGDWVLFLDADEELQPESREKLAAGMRQRHVIAYRLPIVDIGREAEGCSYVPRLFRNAPGLFYVGLIHEQVFSSIEVRREQWGLENRLGDAALLHHGYTAEITRDRNKIARNLRLLERAVEEMPNEPNLLMNFGLELIRAGQFDAGLKQYEEAFHAMAALPPAQVVPELRESLLTQLCTHLMAAKRHDEIVQLLRTPLARLAPLTASLHFSFGLALMELNQHLDAAEQFRHCLQKRSQPALTPINKDILKAGPRHCLALCLVALKRIDEAEKTFQESLMDDPHSRPLRYDYARFLFERGQAVDALRLLHQLIAENTGDLQVWQFGGHIALSHSNFAEFAADWTSESFRHHPQDPMIRQQRAEALLLSQKPAEALSIWEATPASPRSTAGRILAELLANGVTATRLNGEELPASQEFLKWYRRLINLGASASIQSINQQVQSLQPLLPTAAHALAVAMTEADSPA